MATGRIQRVGGTFVGNLPKLILYDYQRIRAEVAALPSLQVFFDLTDPTLMSIESGNRIAQVQDLGPLASHAVASGDDRPTFTSGIITGGFPAAVFNNSKLQSPAMFSGGERLTVCASVYGVGLDSTSQMISSDASGGGENFFTTNTQMRMFSSDLVTNVTALNSRMTNVMWTANNTSRAISIIPAIGAAAVPGTMNINRTMPSGAGNIGAWNDAVSTNRLVGSALGHYLVLNEDVNDSPAVKALLERYYIQRFRLGI